MSKAASNNKMKQTVEKLYFSFEWDDAAYERGICRHFVCARSYDATGVRKSETNFYRILC